MTTEEQVWVLLKELKMVAGNHPDLLHDDIQALCDRICALLPACSPQTRWEFNRYNLHAGKFHPLLLTA